MMESKNMKPKFKAKITKAYLITIEDKDGYEVAHDWSFLNYTEAKKEAEKLLAYVEDVTDSVTVLGYEVRDDKEVL